MRNARTLYIGMALTHAPEAFKIFGQDLIDEFERRDITLLKFVGLTGSDEITVYERDREYTEKADLTVFICDQPSIGLGMEIVFRFFSAKSMLLCAHKEARVTRMVLGFCQKEKVPLHRYQTKGDLIKAIEKQF